jgi:hypothetical protein
MDPVSKFIQGAGNLFGQISIEMASNHGGFKGFSTVKIVSFDPNNSFYNYQIDDVKCCNMLSDEQYGQNTYEHFYCQIVKNEIVAEGKPNFLCKNVLSDYCSQKDSDGEYNINSDLCGMFCGLDDTNCDAAINGYCNSRDFYMTGTNIKSLQKLYDDEICGCTFNPTDTNVFNSYPLTVQKTLKQRLNNPDNISQDLRLECTLPQCKQSKYKLASQKQALKNKTCTLTESCIGDGFIIPTINETDTSSDIMCKSYINTGECIDPPEGVMAIMANPFNNSCKGILKGLSVDLPMGPQYCKLGEQKPVGDCIDNEQLYVRDVLLPGIPANDPNMCPKPDDYPPQREYQYCIPDEKPDETPPDDSKLKNMITVSVVIFLIIFLIIFIFRLIR